MIVCVGSEKGGTGKSMIASNLAIMRAAEGREVLLIDADPQGSAVEFARSRDEREPGVKPTLSCIQVQGRSVAPELKKLRPRYDDIVVDIGGRWTEGFAGALKIADKVVIPFLPSQSDAWALENMQGIVAAARDLNEDLKALMVLNKRDTNPRLSLVGEALEFAGSMEGLDLSTSSLGYRVAFRRAFGEGLSVLELKGREQDKKAAAEIGALAEEVWR